MHATRSHLHLSRRSLLSALTLFMGVWCELGMAYALGGAHGVPRSWLDQTPFHDYVVPGLILGIGVGGSLFGAALALHRGWPRADMLTGAAALVLLIWILEETMLIGLVSVLQPIVAIYAAVLFWLALTSEEVDR